MLGTINVNCSGFEVETVINIRVAKAVLTVAEVPSIEERRIYGVSKLRPARDGLRVLRTILSERFALGPPPPEIAPAFRELERSHDSGTKLLADFWGTPAEAAAPVPQFRG